MKDIEGRSLAADAISLPLDYELCYVWDGEGIRR